jgi:cobalt/nickel transport system permease protein
MINLNNHAQNSKLKTVNPMQKVFFALLTMGTCLWVESVPISIAILAIMAWNTIYKGRTPASLFLKFMIIPASFLLIGVLPIVISISKDINILLVNTQFMGSYVGISITGFQNAIRLIFKSLGAVSCMCYLSLSTPMVDLMSVLRKLKLPKLLIELMELVYRFIFVLIETAETMLRSQKARLGYSSISCGYRSMAALASTLFIRAYKRSEELYNALEARGYDGELNVLEPQFTPISWTKCIAFIILNMLFIMAALFLRQNSKGVSF